MLDVGVAMDLQWSDVEVLARFDAYVDDLAGHLGHKDREGPFRHYCAGLLLPGSRKSVEPMALVFGGESELNEKTTTDTKISVTESDTGGLTQSFTSMFQSKGGALAAPASTTFARRPYFSPSVWQHRPTIVVQGCAGR